MDPCFALDGGPAAGPGGGVGPGGSGGDGEPNGEPDGKAHVRLAGHVAVSAAGTEAEAFLAPDAEMVPLPRASAIVHVLETAGGALRVHRDDATSAFGMLPPEGSGLGGGDGRGGATPGPRSLLR